MSGLRIAGVHPLGSEKVHAAVVRILKANSICWLDRLVQPSPYLKDFVLVDAGGWQRRHSEQALGSALEVALRAHLHP